MKKVKNDLFDYQNRYIYQYEDGFKFSLDSILLAEYIKVPKNGIVLDMCTGNAPIPLILSTKYSNIIHCFEIQSNIAELAIESVKENNLESSINVYNDDVKNISNYFPSEYFDVISCNPPYFKNNIINYNKNDYLSIARHEILITLEDIFKIASNYLKQNGYFYLVHRVDRLDDIIIFGNKYKIPVKEIQLIATKDDNVPCILLVKCLKNGKSGIKIKNIININKLKSYKSIFDKEVI